MLVDLLNLVPDTQGSKCHLKWARNTILVTSTASEESVLLPGFFLSLIDQIGYKLAFLGFIFRCHC